MCKENEQIFYGSIAVIDLSSGTLWIYHVPEDYDTEQTEKFIRDKGHHLSNCSWGRI